MNIEQSYIDMLLEQGESLKSSIIKRDSILYHIFLGPKTKELIEEANKLLVNGYSYEDMDLMVEILYKKLLNQSK